LNATSARKKYAKCSLFFYWQKLKGVVDPQGVSGIAALFQSSRRFKADGVFVAASHNKEGLYQY
jgi:hypothetical protein